jgi:tetratricopeptide (TPR) repeat protein
LVNAADVEKLLPMALSRPTDAYALATRLLDQRPAARPASIAYQARAIVLRDLGRTDEAIADLRRALRLARAAQEPERAIDVQATLGLTLGLAGRTAAGLAALDEAASQSNGVLAGRVMMRRGSLLRELGRYSEALTDLHRSITLLRRGGDAVWQARAHNHRFLVYAMLGQAARADRDLVIAGRLLAEAGQELESAMAVHSRADVAFQSGDLPAALSFLDQAGERYAALSVVKQGLPVDRCAVLMAAGLAAEALVVTDSAIRRIDRDGAYATKKAELLFAAARAAQAAGEPATAAERAAAARDLFRAQRRPWWQARASFVLLQSRHQAGDRSGRLRAQASRIADHLDQLGAEEAPTAHLLAGRLAADRGRAAEADRHLARAARFRHRGPTFGRPAGWLAHALRAEARGATSAALVACRRGLAAAEEHQRALGAAELRAHATAYGTELAAIAQRHATRRGDARMLLVWTERWRASALAVPPVRPPDDRELAADLAALREVGRRLEAAHADGSATSRLEHDRLRLEESIRSRTRRAAAAARGRDQGAGTGVDEILHGLGGHRLVELVTVDDLLYAVTAVGRRVRMHLVGPVRDAVREVDLARFMLRRFAYGRPAVGALANLDAASERLQRALLGPSAAELAGGPVVVVPPGRLHAVPWSLLPVLRGTPVRVAPSASTWLRARQAPPPRGRQVALVGGPGLDGTAAEIAKIAQGYPDAVVLGDGRATAERTLAALDGAWTAHVAAHGVFRADNPLFSSLRLDDGPLTVYDLGRLRRAPFRLVLSSCDSGVAAHVGADELLGMVSALVPLGTVNLLASVVPVNDAATAPFMMAFHDHLRAGADFAEALCAAQGSGVDDPVAAATALSFVALGR